MLKGAAVSRTPVPILSSNSPLTWLEAYYSGFLSFNFPKLLSRKSGSYDQLIAGSFTRCTHIEDGRGAVSLYVPLVAKG